MDPSPGLLKCFFNSIIREQMFEKARDHIPSIAPWIKCCYGSKPLLHLRDHVIHSCRGVQQGDHWAWRGFALTQEQIQDLRREGHIRGEWGCEN